MHRRLAAITAVALAAALLGGCGDGSKKAVLHPTTTVLSGPAPTLAASISFSRVTAAPLATGGGAASTVAAMVPPAPAGPWRAAGTRIDAGGTTTATVWSSPDTASWTAVPLDVTGADSQVTGATTWGTKTVVIGSVGQGTAARAAVWMSPTPAGPFKRAHVVDTAPAGSPTEMGVVGAGGLGVFAAGRTGAQQSVWYSADGLHWAALGSADRVVNSAVGADIKAIAVTARGVFAAGTVLDGTSTDAALWTSADGITWGRVRSADEAFTGGGDHLIDGLVPLGTGLLAVGGERSAGGEWSPASWLSPDGASWSSASLAFPMAVRQGADPGSPALDDGGQPAGAVVTAVDTAAGGLMAVGGRPGAPRMWTSLDGLAWREVALPAPAATAQWRPDLVATDGSTTVIGDDSAGVPRVLTYRGSKWNEVTANPQWFGVPWAVATPARLVGAGSRLTLAVNVDQPGQVLGAQTTSVSVLTSPDGRQWQADATPSVWSNSVVHDVLDAAGQLVAVGGQAPVEAVLGAGSPAPLAWTSGDDNVWTGGHLMSGGGGSPSAQARAVNRLGGHLTAVGEAAPAPGVSAGDITSQAVAWISSDGSSWQPTGPLDQLPSAGFEQPSGACARTTAVVAVGTGSGVGGGTVALAWSSADGAHWRPARVTAPAVQGGAESIRGCVTTPNGFVAYGSETAADGVTGPALWRSPDGLQWTRQTVNAFSGPQPAIVTGLAVRGSDWLALTGMADPSSPYPAAPATATATSTVGGAVGVWESADSGLTWQRIDTAALPALGLDAAFLQTAFIGAVPVISGRVNGQLAVWVGTPLPTPNGNRS